MFWDRSAIEIAEYKNGKFERVYAERPRIVLRYPGGISPVDLFMLPLIVERLQVEYPSCALHVRAVQDEGAAAAVTITVEDLVNRDAGDFIKDVAALRAQIVTLQRQLMHEEKLKLTFEAKYQAARKLFQSMLDGAMLRSQVYIGYLAGSAGFGGSMSRDTYGISGQAAAVGPNSRAEGNTFQQIQGGLDLPRLVEELARLRTAVRSTAEGAPEQDEAIGAIAAAERAARQGNQSAVLQYLKAAGGWAFEIAEKIGVGAVIKAIEKAMQSM